MIYYINLNDKIVLYSISSMSNKKFNKKVSSKIIAYKEENHTSPRNAKIVLFVFGLGPLLLMIIFLFSNGFFNSPS